MSDLELVKMGHTRHDLGELKDVGRYKKKLWERASTHQSQTVCLWVGFCILHHIPAGHPLGKNAETVWVCGYRNPQQRQDVRMGQIFPTDDLSA